MDKLFNDGDDMGEGSAAKPLSPSPIRLSIDEVDLFYNDIGHSETELLLAGQLLDTMRDNLRLSGVLEAIGYSFNDDGSLNIPLTRGGTAIYDAACLKYHGEFAKNNDALQSPKT